MKSGLGLKLCASLFEVPVDFSGNSFEANRRNRNTLETLWVNQRQRDLSENCSTWKSCTMSQSLQLTASSHSSTPPELTGPFSFSPVHAYIHQWHVTVLGFPSAKAIESGSFHVNQWGVGHALSKFLEEPLHNPMGTHHVSQNTFWQTFTRLWKITIFIGTTHSFDWAIASIANCWSWPFRV